MDKSMIIACCAGGTGTTVSAPFDPIELKKIEGGIEVIEVETGKVLTTLQDALSTDEIFSKISVYLD